MCSGLHCQFYGLNEKLLVKLLPVTFCTLLPFYIEYSFAVSKGGLYTCAIQILKLKVNFIKCIK